MNLGRLKTVNAAATVLRKVAGDRAVDKVRRRSEERIGIIRHPATAGSAISRDDTPFEDRSGSEFDADAAPLDPCRTVFDHAPDKGGSRIGFDRHSAARDVAVAVANDHVSNRGMRLERDPDPTSAQIMNPFG